MEKGKLLKIKDIFLCLLYVFLALVGMTFIKLGGQEFPNGIHSIKDVFNIKIMLGMLFYGMSFLLYTLVLSQMQISVMIPIVAAINTCGMVLIGLTIFNETLSLGQMVGIAIVIIGVLIIGIFSK